MVFLNLAFPTWVFSGGHPDYAMPMLLLSLVLLGVMILSLLVPGKVSRSPLPRVTGLLRDPVFYAGLMLAGICWLQWRHAVWPEGLPDKPGFVWMTRTPAHGWTFFSVNGKESFHVFSYVVGSIAVVLGIRHGITQRRSVLILFRLMLINAGVVSLFGIIQYVSGTNEMYWMYDARRHFFASFYYENHAAQYVYLHLALMFGLLAHYLIRRKKKFKQLEMISVPILILVLFLAVTLSFSRSGILFGFLILIISVCRLFKQAPRSISPVQKYTAAGGVAAFSLLGLVLVSGTLGDDIRTDFQSRRPDVSIVEQSLLARNWQWKAALDITHEYPLFGIGGQGFRYFVPFYSEPDKAASLSSASGGQVHNDFLHALCEWGWIGVSAWLVLLLIPLLRLVPGTLSGRELITFTLPGVICVYLHSLWDLPFRSPAVLFHTLAVVCGLGAYHSLTETAKRRSPGTGSKTISNQT
jgi:O-antigen ligase